MGPLGTGESENSQRLFSTKSEVPLPLPGTAVTPGWPRGQLTKWKINFKSASCFRKLVLATRVVWGAWGVVWESAGQWAGALEAAPYS